MSRHGWTKSDLHVEEPDDGDGVTEPLIELGEYEEDDAATLPWLPPIERRPPARR
jgi:hypothetical protein